METLTEKEALIILTCVETVLRGYKKRYLKMKKISKKDLETIIKNRQEKH